MARLEELLDQAAEALLRGDLAALPALTEAIGAKTGSLAEDAPDAGRLREKADRNARLAQAAARGVRAARGRLSEIASGPILTTYDALGRRASVPPPQAAAKRL
ncbi:hypothetical protein [Tabrizicola sp.]|uniref:hypothetical protein n=1 Tax=Tabrizicola sp. TaxID=2005166 RepID=UPI0035B4402E